MVSEKTMQIIEKVLKFILTFAAEFFLLTAAAYLGAVTVLSTQDTRSIVIIFIIMLVVLSVGAKFWLEHLNKDKS